ncbi:MAG: fused MFS/spermidine synthase [Nitrospirota bacterium]
MVVELGVARILTPVFGGSISVWAIVLATTMLALAAGYAFGGHRADRTGGIVVACRAATIGAALCAAVPWLRVPLVEATVDLPTLAGAALAGATLLAPSMFFLGQVSPSLIRGLASGGVAHVGGTAGGVYAISTMGSLVGTLAAAWLFLYTPLAVGFVGTAALVVLPAMLLRAMVALAGTVIVALLAGLLIAGGSQNVTGMNRFGQECRLVAKRHSPYGELRVIDQGDIYRYMIVNGADQGGIDLKTGRAVYTFDDALIAVTRLYAERPQTALVIGLGAGVISSVLERDGVDVETVEIDAEVVRAAREYFGYTGTVFVDDGRRYLQRTDHTWDAIIVDAFLGGNPPWQLFTEEAFALYAAHLNTGGVVSLNFIGSHLDPSQRPALEAVVSTARQVFRTVDCYPHPWESDDYPTRNIFIAAAAHPRRHPPEPGDPSQTRSLTAALARSTPVVVADGRVLTDGSAPLEPLVRRTTEMLRGRTRYYLPANVLFQ